MEYFGIIIGIIIIIIGLVGAVLPFLPGLPLAYIGVIILNYTTGGQLFGSTTLIVLGLIALSSLLIDYFSGLLGAKIGKASMWGTIGAFIGTIVGFSTMGIIGLIIGPALGLAIFELIVENDHRKIIKSTKSTLITSLLGLIVSALLAIIFAVGLALAVIF